MSGMDSNIPTRERAFRMIVTLLDAVEFSPEELTDIAVRVRVSKGRPRVDVCIRGHVRTPLTITKNGSCIPCRRIREKAYSCQTKRASSLCECGHAKRKHEPECYQSENGVPVCPCERYRRAEP